MTFDKTWTETLTLLASLKAPSEFANKDLFAYGEASEFLRSLAKALDPIVDDLCSALQDTSGVANSSVGENNVTSLFSDFIIPEFDSTISMLQDESDEGEAMEPTADPEDFT